ncbi:protein Wnt-5a-like [Acropora muricata]|uniref:protein Wnt-5a-like n=1 Tax=Acropora muricata TaxID=159855 RepID=UPI0034E611E1
MNQHTESQAKIILEFMMRARRRAHNVPFFFTLVVLSSFFQTGQSVWSLGIPHQLYMFGTVRRFCDGMPDLNMEQKALCEENRDVMASIRYGATLAVKQCQYQFQYRRWNCSLPEQDRYTLFRRITGKGTKEAAFTYSISAAGVVYSIARSCVEGNLSVCGCSRERRPKNLNSEFQWGGCGDNIDYGSKYTTKFMKAGERKTEGDTSEQEMSKMNIHNIEVGIKIVKNESKIVCKCHGMSGSCNLQTCQRELSLFVGIGNALHEKYDNAVRTKLERHGAANDLYEVKKNKNGGYRRNSAKLKSTLKKPDSGTMVFLNESPQYCKRDPEYGFPGTGGRTCRINSYGSDSCDELCCGRGYHQRQVLTKSRCKCKFHWCCEIRCKQCSAIETKYFCDHD